MSGGAVCSFSARVSIFWLSRMARPKLSGAGMPLLWRRKLKLKAKFESSSLCSSYKVLRPRRFGHGFNSGCIGGV